MKHSLKPNVLNTKPLVLPPAFSGGVIACNKLQINFRVDGCGWIFFTWTSSPHLRNHNKRKIISKLCFLLLLFLPMVVQLHSFSKVKTSRLLTGNSHGQKEFTHQTRHHGLSSAGISQETHVQTSVFRALSHEVFLIVIKLKRELLGHFMSFHLFSALGACLLLVWRTQPLVDKKPTLVNLQDFVWSSACLLPCDVSKRFESSEFDCIFSWNMLLVSKVKLAVVITGRVIPGYSRSKDDRFIQLDRLRCCLKSYLLHRLINCPIIKEVPLELYAVLCAVLACFGHKPSQVWWSALHSPNQLNLQPSILYFIFGQQKCAARQEELTLQTRWSNYGFFHVNWKCSVVTSGSVWAKSKQQKHISELPSFELQIRSSQTSHASAQARSTLPSGSKANKHIEWGSFKKEKQNQGPGMKLWFIIADPFSLDSKQAPGLGKLHQVQQSP